MQPLQPIEKGPLRANYQFPVWTQIFAHLVLYSIQISNFKHVYLTNRSSYKLQTKCNWKLTDCTFVPCDNPKIKVCSKWALFSNPITYRSFAGPTYGFTKYV